MTANGDDAKQRAHQLLDRLEPKQASAVVGLLEMMLDPVSRAIANAPKAEEPLQPDDENALNESRTWSMNNKSVPHEQVLADLGVTQEELDRFMKSS